MPLSKAVALLVGMCDRGHIESDLFSLLLTSSVYRGDDGSYLRGDRIDKVDIARFLEAA